MATGQINLRTVKLGDNADTSKNFLITTPAIADGTLTIQRESGAVVASINAAGTLVLPNFPLLPTPVWTVMGAARVFGTTYTNDTGHDLTIRVRVSLPAVTGGIQCTCQGITLFGSSMGTGNATCETWVIPIGATYVVSYSAGSGGTIIWQELR